MKRMLLLGATAFVLAFGPAMASTQRSKASNTKYTHHMMGKHQMMAANKLTGKVKSWNGSQLSVTTAAGKEETFVLAPDAARPDNLTTGSQVTVWYKETNGQKTADRIALAGNRSTARRAKAGKHMSRHGSSSRQSGS